MGTPKIFRMVRWVVQLCVDIFRRRARRERLRRRWIREITRRLGPAPARDWPLIGAAATAAASGSVPLGAFEQILRDVETLRREGFVAWPRDSYFFGCAVADLCVRSGVPWKETAR
jgi:hypothetical protein